MSEIRLSKNEATAIHAWSDSDVDFGFLSFGAVAEKSDLPKHLIRRTVRSLARKGVLQFAKGLTTDEGEFYGSGYGLTSQGRLVIDAMSSKAKQVEKDQ